MSPRTRVLTGDARAHLAELAGKTGLSNLISEKCWNRCLPAFSAFSWSSPLNGYTSYTPYQPGSFPGRLESFANYQTMVSSLTSGFTHGQCVVVGRGTTFWRKPWLCLPPRGKKKYVVDAKTYPQTQVGTRAGNNGEVNGCYLDPCKGLDQLKNLLPEDLLQCFSAISSYRWVHNRLFSTVAKSSILPKVAAAALIFLH